MRIYPTDFPVMSKLVFRLRNVPDDEAEAVRALLDERGFDWYETTAGNWGIAMPGIWVREDAQASSARELIDSYQRERSATKRREYEQSVQSGESTTLKDLIRTQPLRMAGIVIFCLFIVYVSLKPFLQLARQ